MIRELVFYFHETEIIVSLELALLFKMFSISWQTKQQK